MSQIGRIGPTSRYYRKSSWLGVIDLPSVLKPNLTIVCDVGFSHPAEGLVRSSPKHRHYLVDSAELAPSGGLPVGHGRQRAAIAFGRDVVATRLANDADIVVVGGTQNSDESHER